MTSKGAGTRDTPIGGLGGVRHLPNSPNLICLGEACKNLGYHFEWQPGAPKPTFKKDGKELGVKMEGLVPTLAGTSVEEEEVREEFQSLVSEFLDHLGGQLLREAVQASFVSAPAIFSKEPAPVKKKVTFSAGVVRSVPMLTSQPKAKPEPKTVPVPPKSRPSTTQQALEAGRAPPRILDSWPVWGDAGSEFPVRLAGWVPHFTRNSSNLQILIPRPNRRVLLLYTAETLQRLMVLLRWRVMTTPVQMMHGRASRGARVW